MIRMKVASRIKSLEIITKVSYIESVFNGKASPHPETVESYRVVGLCARI